MRRDRLGSVILRQLPLLLVVVSLFLLMAFHCYLAVRDRSNLSELRAGREQPLQEAMKLRQQLNSLAGEAAQLAIDGDAGAKAVVADMKRQGVALAPPKK